MSKPMTPTEQDKKLREKLAAIEHERWADWQRWMHEKARMTDQGHLIIDREDVERWERQIATPYSDLSEKEKASDMEQVDRYWQLITADRERVALEARIETLDALDNHRKTLNYIVKDGAPRNHTNYEVYMRKAIEVDTKIAELKAQQEKVK